MTPGDPNRESLKILTRRRRSLSAESKTCGGCRICEVVCSLTHEGSIDLERSRIHLRPNSLKGSFIPIICRQCADAPCRRACPESAMELEAGSGIVSIREELCTGCLACQNACPFHAIRFDAFRKKALKCDLCHGAPACVDWCPTHSLGLTQFGGSGEAKGKER